MLFVGTSIIHPSTEGVFLLCNILDLLIYSLKNIYAILNVTKGIVADGESFFFKAFGRNVEEFYVILSMPKEFVTYRNYFEENGLAAEWRDKFLQLSIEEKNELLQVLSEKRTTQNSRLIELLGYYSIRKETE